LQEGARRHVARVDELATRVLLIRKLSAERQLLEP
jgi:hypothetical protein